MGSTGTAILQWSSCSQTNSLVVARVRVRNPVDVRKWSVVRDGVWSSSEILLLCYFGDLVQTVSFSGH